MGEWINRRKGWLSGYKSKEKKHSKEKKEEIDNYAVIFYPIKCPKCRSKDVGRYKSALPIRYHKCKKCGHNFKSIEEK